MKGITVESLLKAILCITLISFVLGCQDTKQKSNATVPATEKEKISYAVGANMGRSISEISDEIDLSMLQKGMTDKIQGKELLVSNEEAQTLLMAFSEKLRAKEQKEMSLAAQKNLEEGKAFLEEKKTKKGVITT